MGWGNPWRTPQWRLPGFSWVRGSCGRTSFGILFSSEATSNLAQRRAVRPPDTL